MKKIFFVLPVLTIAAFIAIAIFVIFLEKRTRQEPVFPPVNEISEIPAAINVLIKSFAFNPSEGKIKVGGKIMWTNQDATPHSIEINGMTKSTNLSKGDSFEFVFNKTGTYNYICGIHPYMKGKIIVIE